MLILVAIGETENLRSHKCNLIICLDEWAQWEEQPTAKCEQLGGELRTTKLQVLEFQ